MTTSSFSFSRFCLLLRRDLYEHKKEHRNTALASFITLGLFTTLFLTFTRSYVDGVYTIDAHQVAIHSASVALFAFHLGILIKISSLFSNLHSKQGRITFFITPASNCEKYLVRIVQSTFVAWGIMLLTIPLTDAIFWLVAQVLQFNYESFTSTFLHYCYRFCNFVSSGSSTYDNIYIHPLYAWAIYLTTVLSIMTNYVVGASIFRRYPFIMTSVSLFLIGILTSIISGLLVAFFFQEKNIGEMVMQILGLSSLEEFFVFMLHFLFWSNILWVIGGNYWAYRSFTRANAIAQRSIGL